MTKELSLQEINARVLAHIDEVRLATQASEEALRAAAATAFGIPTTPVLIEATPQAAQARMAAKIAKAKADAPKA